MRKKRTKKIRTKRVPATTANLTQSILAFLNNRGHFAFDVYNGAVFDPVKMVFRKRRKDKPAISDVICVLNPGGIGLYIEVKNAATGDKAKSAQRKFAANVSTRGAYHFFAKEYVSFTEWYRRELADYEQRPQLFNH